MSENAPHMALYETKVHARNLNSDYGIRVDVYAVDRQDAVNRAVAIGWLGYPDEACVTVLQVVDTRPAPAQLDQIQATPPHQED